MAKDLLDLHGFKCEDVIDVLDRFIVDVNNKNLPSVRIMTGKGTGAVKKLVIHYLRQAHYPWTYEKLPNGKVNEGVILVIL